MTIKQAFKEATDTVWAESHTVCFLNDGNVERELHRTGADAIEARRYAVGYRAALSLGYDHRECKIVGRTARVFGLRNAQVEACRIQIKHRDAAEVAS